MHFALFDIWLARIYCLLINQVSITNLFYQVTAQTGTGSTDATFATQLDATLGPDMRALLGTDAAYLGVTVQRQNPLPKTAPAIDNTNAGAGTGAGVALTPQVAPIIQWHTTSAGRKYRGRAFLPFADFDGQDPATKETTAPYRAKMDTFALDAIGPFTFGTVGNTSTLGLVLVRHATPPTVNATITSHFSRAAYGTQRRRSFVKHGDALPF